MLSLSKRKYERDGPHRRQQEQGIKESARSSSRDNMSQGDSMNCMATFQQWSFDEGHVGIVLHTLSFLSVVELVEKKPVCKQWQQLCTQAIDNKCASPKSFDTRGELRDAVTEYCGTYHSSDTSKIEKIAIVYGYPINKWRVQELEDFSAVFYGQYRFNEDISSWDLSNAKTMRGMFYDARAFNQPLPWCTSSVTNMAYLFCRASSFNQTLPWNTGKVIDMSDMFHGAEAFNKPLPWNTGNVTCMDSMFAYAHAFNQSLESWDTRKLTNIEDLFYLAANYNQPMSTWDTSKIVNMRWAFENATSFNQSLTNWVFHNDVRTSGMLRGATTFDQELPDALDPNVVFQ